MMGGPAGGDARISMDDQTMAVQADALTRAAVDVVFEEESSGANNARPVLREDRRCGCGRAIRSWCGGSIGSAGRWAMSSRLPPCRASVASSCDR
jgi:hypothetical protein